MECLKILGKRMLLVIGIIICSSSYAHEISPIGYWKVIDETTGKPKSIIQISRNTDNSLTGKIIKVFSNQKNQSIVGTIILTGLVQNQDRWNQGKWLDMKNGRDYGCSVRLTEDGKKLHVQGSRGLPFLSRTETWERVDLLSGAGIG